MEEEYVRFVENAYRLKNSAFMKWVLSGPKKYEIEKIIGGNWLAHENLREEDLDSFCLKLRLLIQDRDGFSIRCIRQMIINIPDEYTKHREAIESSCKDLEKRLSENSVANIKNSGSTTNKELFEVIFYGGIVHEDKKMRDEYRSIVRSGIFSFFVFQSFKGVLLHYNNCIQNIAYHLVQYEKEKMANKSTHITLANRSELGLLVWPSH